MKSSKRRIFTAIAVIALAIMICFALLACDNKTNTTGQNGDQNGNENTQVSISIIDDLGEILATLGDSYSVSEKVLASAQRKYGFSLAVLKSENADGTGEILVGIDEDGSLKVATASLSLSADDFTARVFKSGTFTKTGDKISYYQGDKKQEEDISGAFTKTAENGDLTVIDTTKADQKISAVFDNVTLEESGLNTEITNTDKEIFELVVGNAISADKEVFLPSLICNYNSMTDKTEVEAVYYLGGNITVCTVSFEGNITADGFNKDEAQNQIYKETATVATEDKDCTEYDGYSTIYCKTFAPLTVEKVPSAQDLEEVITFNSWEEVFNVFGEENRYLIENKLNEIFIEKLFNEQNIKSLFGNTCSLEDLSNGKIEMLKWAFVLNDNNEISAIQMLGIRNGYRNEYDKILQNGIFELNESLSHNDIFAKTNVLYEETGQYVLCVENIKNSFIIVDFTEFAKKLKLSDNGTSWDGSKGYTPADEEGIDIFNLLMPYAVNEKTTYSHVSVRTSEILDIIDIMIYALNEKTNVYEYWHFVFYREDDEASETDETLTYYQELYAMMDRLLKQEKYKCTLQNKQMLSGDIIFSLDNDDITYYEINPTAQQ